MNPTILFTGGGTLGSVMPLLAVSEELTKRRPAWRQAWVGTRGGPEKSVIAPRLSYYDLPVFKFRRYWSWRTLKELFMFPLVLWQADRLVKTIKPTVVVSAGGYVGVPIGWMAKRRGAKILIHQQDVTPGLANRLLVKAADQITCTFIDAQHFFPPAKTIQTGNPVRSQFLTPVAGDVKKRYRLTDAKPLVLILGGGTGARALNELVAKARPKLSGRVAIFHSTGATHGYPPENTADYVSRPIIIDDLPELMSAADLVVTRAGLGTLSELSALHKPTVIIPIPDTHQEANAAALEASGAAVVLDQAKLTADQFVIELMSLISHPTRRQELSARMGEWNKPNAAGALAGLIEKMAG